MIRSIALILTFGLALTAAAETITVTPDGPLTIQAAVYQALPGDVVELVDGLYTGPGNRDVVFQGKAITVRSQSGDPAACVIDCEGSASEYHRGFDLSYGEEIDSILEGVTITGGYHSHGGAVACIGGAPTIRHCRFVDNVANEGGGIIAYDPARIEDCWFEGNHATFAGGGSSAQIAWYGGPIFRRCTYVNNTAEDSGGGHRT